MADPTQVEAPIYAAPPERGPDDWPVPFQPVWGPDDSLWRKVEALTARSTLSVIGRLPEPLLSGTIGALARIGRRVDKRHADAARRFLKTALATQTEDEREEQVLQAYRHFLRVVVDGHRWDRVVPWERTMEHFQVEWTEDVKRVIADDHGCILVSAHLGNWEVMLTLGAWLGFDPAYAVAKPMKSRPLSKATQASREKRGIRLLPRRGAMAAVPKILGQGGTLGLLLDQRARVKPVFAPFFGRNARCDRSAGVLVRRSKAPVVMPFCTYIDERKLLFRVEFPPVIWPDEIAASKPEQIAARINGMFEEAILRHPDQYFWLHDRYRDTPEVPPGREPSE